MNAFHYINMMVVEEKSAESITALDTNTQTPKALTNTAL